LNVEWSGNFGKVSEFFNSLDLAAHQGQLRYVSITEIGESILLNTSKNADEFVSDSIMTVHKALKDRNMLGKLRDLLNFINSNRDETCENNEFKRILKEIIEPPASSHMIPLLSDAKYD
jgi:hypothetical protein